MFDLEHAIRSWRRHLGRDALLTPADLNELEDHLHDEIEQLEAGGVAGEEAFHTAVERLGDADSLRREFNKNGGTRRTLFAALRLLLILPWTPLWWHFFYPDFPGIQDSPVPLDVIVINTFDLFGRALVYLVAIWLSARSRQWVWAGLFGWILALPWVLNYLSLSELWIGNWSMYVYLLTMPAVLLLSIFWVYPPAFALDLRRRLAPAWGARRRITGLRDEGVVV